MASTGSAVQALKWAWSTLSRRSTSTARLVLMNTMSSRMTTVSASTAMPPVAVRTMAQAVVTTIATHGVRRPGSTRPSARGNSPSPAMP